MDYIDHSICAATTKCYKRFFSRYTSFCEDLGKKKFSASSVPLWVASLAQEGRTHGAILSHVSALKYFSIKLDSDKPIDSKKLKLLLRGIKNKNKHKHVRARPTVLSRAQLKLMVKVAESTLGRKDGIRFKAMICCAFFGFLRPGEYCLTKAGHKLWRQNVIVEKEHVQLFLPSYKHSKDEARVRILATGGSTCPHRRITECLSVWPNSKYLFDISYVKFRSQFAEVVAQAGIPSNMTPHALRRGGATWASLEGWPDSRIRSFGRWSSDAFKRYIMVS